MSFFNRTKKITAYALINKNVKNKFLTITRDLEQACEYATLLLKFQHQFHYEAWCGLRELDKDAEESWMQYFVQCVCDADKDQFKIIKVKYDLNNILAILRMFGNCVPLGCSFDTEVEKNYFRAIIEETMAQQLSETSHTTPSEKENNSNGNK